MIGNILSFNWIPFLFTILTLFLICSDKEFSKKIRMIFRVALLLCLFLTILTSHLGFTGASSGSSLAGAVFISECILRPVIIALLVYLFVVLKQGNIDYAVAGVEFVIICIAFAVERYSGEKELVNNALCLISIFNYYYFEVQNCKVEKQLSLHIGEKLHNAMEDDFLSGPEDGDDRRNSELMGEDTDDANRQQLIKDIIDNNRLKYAFQPIVSAVDGEIIAYESLMRSDTEIPVSPLAIIKYAEDNKRLYDIERYTFFNVFKRLTDTDDFPKGARIFINSLPGYMLRDEDYEDLRGRYGNWFERMVIEITEQREVEDDALSMVNVRRGQDGFNLAIDDYGSGYSNTNSLLRYMPQVIKLDRLLIAGIDKNSKKQFFVNSIISFAKDNDMKTLAEGVETEGELKTVIKLGVDMIQGYYTARPALDIVASISEEVRKVIIEENLKVGTKNRKIYNASDDCELSAVRLAMEDYTKINTSAERIKIVGSSEYAADLVIKIMDGTNCRMTLSDVRLNSVDDEPCIEIGEGAHLTLDLEGDSKLNEKGIHVPEGSSLTIAGKGNLEIYSKGHDCYGIGSGFEESFGSILLKNSGVVTLSVDGENCVGIGGGTAGEHSKIEVNRGTIDLHIAGVYATGIGCVKECVPVDIKDCKMTAGFRVNTGCVIGSMYGEQDTRITNFDVDIEGSGTCVSGVGSVGESTGNITFDSGHYKIKLNGQKLNLIGAPAGKLDIRSSHVNFEMLGEGDNVLGIGSLDRLSSVTAEESSIDLTINASNPLGFGSCQEESKIGFRGQLSVARINGITRVIREEE